MPQEVTSPSIVAGNAVPIAVPVDPQWHSEYPIYVAKYYWRGSGNWMGLGMRLSHPSADDFPEYVAHNFD